MLNPCLQLLLFAAYKSRADADKLRASFAIAGASASLASSQVLLRFFSLSSKFSIKSTFDILSRLFLLLQVITSISWCWFICAVVVCTVVAPSMLGLRALSVWSLKIVYYHYLLLIFNDTWSFQLISYISAVVIITITINLMVSEESFISYTLSFIHCILILISVVINLQLAYGCIHNILMPL